MSLSDSVARTTLSLYSALKFRPANPAQYTILSSFTLIHRSGSIAPISLATGSKCLPAARLSTNGDAVHDSHAEVLARRGAVRWLMKEMCRSATKRSAWLEPKASGKWGLKDGVSVHMYISTLEEGGDASTRTLAALPQDPAIATLKSTTPFTVPVENAAARGRDNYGLLGVLRTKPGRADSPPTLSMSCSDKIARWCVLGFQGALASNILDPLYVDEIVLGGVDPTVEESVREDCTRAFWKRIESAALEGERKPVPSPTVINRDPGDVALPHPFKLHPPRITFTSLEFLHGRAQLESTSPASSCNESICWIADSSSRYEVLIHGLRRGVGDKQRAKPHLRPLVSKLALFALYQQTLMQIGLSSMAYTHLETDNPSPETTYHEAKQAASDYQEAKLALRTRGIFAGWVISGKKWESFTVDGTTVPEPTM
ncbi:adenosine deaminase/editase [Ramaria rubella]|nr:adenosine deaminase/editase [Ramaria rubella]